MNTARVKLNSSNPIMAWEITKSARVAQTRSAAGGRRRDCAPRPGIWLLLGACACLAACHPPATSVRLNFHIATERVADYSVAFYVSGLTMIDAEGHAVPARLDANPWQNESTALVALGGRTENPVVSGRVAGGRYDAMEFRLGIPFDANHGNPLVAAAPLNVPSMFWTWQSGYKFVRVDIANDWSFHLGSTGCVSASAVRPAKEPCRQPNAARIRLASDTPATGTIVLDLDALLAHIDPAVEDNCMEAYADRDACRGLLANLGMDPDTGLCLDGCESQTVFQFAP